MKDFWKKVSKKDVIFLCCIFLAVVALSLAEPFFKITVSMDDVAVKANSNRYAISVKYDLIETVELVEMPHPGTIIEGYEDVTIRYGKWTNDAWGEYYVCAIPNATNCIVLHLNDGRTFVLNARSNEYTAELFAQLQSHLSK